MMVGFLQHVQLFVFVTLLSFRVAFAHSTNTSNIGTIKCLKKEREALLKFKDDLIDEYGRLSSWGNKEDMKDCCKWKGILCHNLTNNVIILDLHGDRSNLAPLRGKISPWLLEIKHLEYLDLSRNDFDYSRIPQFIGSLRRLQHLDLSSSNFSRLVPPHLGNLSKLQFLALDSEYGTSMSSTNLDWVSQLHPLRYLSLSFVNLTMATNWFQAINKLSRLEVLNLSFCNLPMVLSTSPSMFNASRSFSHLDLAGNDIYSSWLLPWLFNFSQSHSLIYLELGGNNLQGPIPDAIGNLVSLSYLSLFMNQFEGGLPVFLGNLSSLSHLDLKTNKLNGRLPGFPFSSSLTYLSLSHNMFSGIVPQSMGNLSKLEYLDLGSNNLEGVITESHFFNLSKLQTLGLSSNRGISINFSLGWKPPFQLVFASFTDCIVGPYFPTWLRTQKRLYLLQISNASITDTIPDWFWELTPKLGALDASHNNLHGTLPDLSSKFPADNVFLDMSFNNFSGSLPILPPYISQLDLSYNKFSGPITSMCIGTKSIKILNLSDNLFSGQIPECFANLPPLDSLGLANNSFSGKIPSLKVMSSLHLHKNNFTGEIPESLKNCTSLSFIDLSLNNLSGEIPTWVGDSWTNLVFLSLRSNQFTGTIPSNLCHLELVQVLDLSLNKISGDIPKCLNKLTALTREVNHENDGSFNAFLGKFESAFLMWKGAESQYMRTLRLVKLIDLSSNNLVGDIPPGITSLVTLIGLNLSRNNISGFIPANIGELRYLDFLDLSRNHLDSGIPTSLSQLDLLGTLDLSHNKLTGKIPQSIHLQTFNASSFEENPGLCGLPLSKACPGDEITQDQKIFGVKNQKEEDKLFDEGFYISMAVGFAFGFWGVCGALFFNRSWRITFFNSWNRTMDWLYVMITISKIRIGEALHKFV